MRIQKALAILLIATACLLSGCASKMQTVPPADELTKVYQAIDRFKQEEKLIPYFEESVGYAIYPSMFRISAGFGGAFGKGFIIKGDDIYRSSDTWQFSAGISGGFQLYRQIIFFKTDEALQQFEEGSFEFASQANIVFLTWGKGGTPAFNQGTAIYTQTRGGLLIEATIGMHHYITSEPLSEAIDQPRK